MQQTSVHVMVSEFHKSLSPYRLRNDRKCVEWDVKPYYTISRVSQSSSSSSVEA